MVDHLKRVLGLVRKTGDTMIVVDKDGQESFVVMDLDQYEMLLDAQFMGEDWDDGMVEGESSEEVLQPQPKTSAGPDIWDVMPAAGEEGETWDIDQLDQEEFADLEKQYEAFASRHVEEAIEKTKTAPKKKEDDEYGEEQFYLEPVE
ncbi:MAG: hypothetical protein NUV84_03725 [Candidatus Uhrbacteria bacterium]|nr:hypothetical protein [Candidatus Uhrbacteria bacterium]